jgi:TorA maturation chaperone TorD
MHNISDPDFRKICFGLNRQTDEQSLAIFLRLFSRDALLQTLIPRLSDAEINELVDQLTRVLRNHLQEDEYHELFLNDPDHHH